MKSYNLGENNPRWKGDDIKYRPLHAWINRNKPKPIYGMCEACNLRPFHDAACITGIYNRDFRNWKYLCCKCHNRFDGTAGFKKGNKICVGRKFSEETKNKLSELRKGKRLSEAIRRNMSINHSDVSGRKRDQNGRFKA